MDEREYIIENITKEEWEILEDNGIDWCPDDMFGMNQDAIIFGEDEYNKTIKLLGRWKRYFKGGMTYATFKNRKLYCMWM